MLTDSSLLDWFFALVLLGLGARAAARLLLARASAASAATGALANGVRDAELAHAAMGFGMAALLVPGLPRPPVAASLCLFAALTGYATFSWARAMTARLRGRVTHCGCAPKDATHLLDPHHAIVGVAMIVMLLRPAADSGMSGMAGAGATDAGMAGVATGAPGVAVLVLLGYVWISALVLGYGMTRLLPAIAGTGPATAPIPPGGAGGTLALLGSPATVYGCELAMTVLTGLMLLS